MLQVIKQMEQQGRWTEIRQQASTLLAGLEGDALARGYLATSKAFELTATSPADYRTALAHARAAVASALQGGLMHTWALARVAAYSADMGLYRAAEATACAFLERLPVNPGAAPMEPYALFALGRAQASRRCFADAARTFRRALAGTGEIFERIQLHLAWTLAEAGQVRDAFDSIPSTVEHVPAEHVSAAMAAVLAASGDWAGAQLHAKAALRAHEANRCPIFDTIQAAELALIIHRAAVALGQTQAMFSLHSAAILAGWNEGLILALLPTLRPKGGASYNAAASSCGPAGHQRTGLRGCVG